MKRNNLSWLERIEYIPEVTWPELKQRSYGLYVAWTEAWHLAGSLTLLAIAHVLSLHVGENALLFVFISLLVYITYQEFYRHPLKYHQRFVKGVCDWLAWVVPFVLYFLYLG